VAIVGGMVAPLMQTVLSTPPMSIVAKWRKEEAQRSVRVCKISEAIEADCRFTSHLEILVDILVFLFNSDTRFVSASYIDQNKSQHKIKGPLQVRIFAKQLEVSTLAKMLRTKESLSIPHF
jgi:hypothetical protein